MKTKVAMLILVSFLLVSCLPEIPTQDNEVIDVVTEVPTIEATITQEPLITEAPIATEAPTDLPLTCVTLLTPFNGVEIPPVGKATFSWTLMDEAGNYILNIILPSGNIIPFDTDQTFRDQYFAAGGEYQWQVIAQDAGGSQICISEVAKFEKSAYEASNDSSNAGKDNDNGDAGNDSNDGSSVEDDEPPPTYPGSGY